tara:strand:- start:688 stop:2439 length:1752 start_codon:yes stop_codon:yes gene_type:complete
MFEQIKKLNFLITKRQRKLLVILTVLLFIGMLFEVFGLGVLIPAISGVLDPNFFYKTPEIEPIIQFFGALSQTQFTFLFLGLVVLIYLLKSFFLIVLTYRQNKFLANLNAFLTNALFEKYMKLPYSFHLNRNAGVLIKNIQVEISYLNTFCTGLISLFVESFLILAVITTIVVIEPLGAITMGLFFGTLSTVFYLITKRKLSHWGDKRQQMDVIVSKFALEGLSGIKDLKVLGRTKNYIDIFKSATTSRAIPIYILNTLSQIPRFYLELVTVLGLVFFIAFMIIIEKRTEEIITTLGVFVAASFRMIPSINKIIAALQTLKFYNSSLAVVYNEMKLKSETSSTVHQGDFLFGDKITIENLSFSYARELPNVLNKINLTIEKGKTIGFKGVSGSGKSTLVDTIIGLHYPTEGEIKVDGLAIRDNLANWQQKIGYVSQEIFLADDSIIQNVAFGIPRDKIDKEKVISALNAAQLYGFINELESGLETTVGERGVQLSGGQRQRLGIARALYHNPEILILDEATASLDVDTEKNVMKAIHALKGKKTILIIAHRLTTLEGCDDIYEIKNGFLITNNNKITEANVEQ